MSVDTELLKYDTVQPVGVAPWASGVGDPPGGIEDWQEFDVVGQPPRLRQ